MHPWQPRWSVVRSVYSDIYLSILLTELALLALLALLAMSLHSINGH